MRFESITYNFMIVLYSMLQRLIGLKSSGVERLIDLGMRVRLVRLINVRPWVGEDFYTILVNTVPTMAREF